MNGKFSKTGSFLSLLAILMCNVCMASAQAEQVTGVRDDEQPGILNRLWSDPLRADPNRLSQGVVLPGDATPTLCPPQVNLSSPLSLVNAVDLALCSNPQLRDTWAQIKVQTAQEGQARAAYLPTLSAQVSRLNNRTAYPDFSSANSTTWGHMTYVSLSWLLFDFGGRSSSLEAADDALRAAIDNHDAEMQKLLGEVISDYFNAITAQAKVNASVEDRKLASETENSALRRLEYGEGNQGDLMQARTAAAKVGLTLARNTGERDKAKAELVYALGLTSGSNISVPEILEPKRSEAITALSSWLELAARNQPAIKAAKEHWAATQAKIRSTQSEGLPTLSFVSTFDQNGYPNQGLQTTKVNVTAFGLMLTMPIFDGFSQHYKVAEAMAQADIAQAQMQDTQHQMLKQVVTAYGDTVSAFDSLDESGILLESAQKALESAKNRYEHGVGSMIELLSAQSALADARQQRLESLAQWYAGRLELLAVSGVLGHAELDLDSEKNQ